MAKSLINDETKKAKEEEIVEEEVTKEEEKATEATAGKKRKPKVNPFKHRIIVIDGFEYKPGEELP
ncbi:MAG: hypothetical protein ACOCQD_03145 [archaeon]